MSARNDPATADLCRSRCGRLRPSAAPGSPPSRRSPRRRFLGIRRRPRRGHSRHASHSARAPPSHLRATPRRDRAAPLSTSGLRASGAASCERPAARNRHRAPRAVEARASRGDVSHTLEVPQGKGDKKEMAARAAWFLSDHRRAASPEITAAKPSSPLPTHTADVTTTTSPAESAAAGRHDLRRASRR